MTDYPKPPYPAQQQPMPGSTRAMQPRPDHGEQSYKGAGRLSGKKAIITGGDSGIGRAVAIAYAREGVDIVISYLNEDEVKALVEREGRKAFLIPGDISSPEHCRCIVRRAMEELGGIDILVNKHPIVAASEIRAATSDSTAFNQAAFDALALTPLRNATVFSLVLAAFSSFKLVVRKRTMSSWPSSSAQAISVP